MNTLQEKLKLLPGVDRLLETEEVKKLLEAHSIDLVKHAVRLALSEIRERIINEFYEFEKEKLISDIEKKVMEIEFISLKKVINATGILLHTNLGRAPLGEKVLKDISPIILGYSNLELDLSTGKRGNRNQHIQHIMTYLTKAEQVVVVNNNAAAVFLCLKTFGEKGETIVSRGELIEIGGSFRIPDIMKSSGTKMIEVGTTNKTRLSDFENAITENTKILFKAHRSNFYMEGFTEEVELKDLAALAHKHNLIMIYDIGSGLLRKPESLNLKDEEDIASAIEAGVDIISFSGDKLLGGPQAGIIAGRKEFIGKIAKAPLMRALRVGKLTTSALLSAMRNYMDEKTLLEHNPIFRFLNRNSDELQTLATILKEQLQQKQIECQIITSNAYVGGGTLPKTTISSFSVEILSEKINAEKLYFFLQKLPNPIVGILREGRILFDVFTLNETEIKALSLAIEEYIKA